MTDAVTMRDVIVIGGGCYGTFYAGQLAKAREKGKARYRRVVVVDRDPDCRARRELGPAPLMPHLMFEWVVRRARARWPERHVTVEPVPGTLGTPYDRAAPAPDHTRYVSFADWICPTHCVEPALCPAIGQPRTWEMGEAVTQRAERLRGVGQGEGEGERVSGPALFVCRHHVFGVGTFAVDAVLAGDALVAAAGESGEPAGVLIGTISSCHGALDMLRIGAVVGGNR